jgi:hypothetical protein
MSTIIHEAKRGDCALRVFENAGANTLNQPTYAYEVTGPFGMRACPILLDRDYAINQGEVALKEVTVKREVKPPEPVWQSVCLVKAKHLDAQGRCCGRKPQDSPHFKRGRKY